VLNPPRVQNDVRLFAGEELDFLCSFEPRSMFQLTTLTDSDEKRFQRGTEELPAFHLLHGVHIRS
jgi:hypothetical protein